MATDRITFRTIDKAEEHQKITTFINGLFLHQEYFQSFWENTGSAVQFVEKASHILNLEKADGIAVSRLLIKEAMRS